MAEDRTTIKLMADQLKKDTATTLERLNILAETNTQLAKDSSKPEERKELLKKATAASKARDSLLKQDLSTAGAVKKEFGNLGSSLLGGIDGMLGEAFGPLGGIASTLTTGLVKRKLDAKKNLEGDILNEERSKEVAETLEGVKESTEEVSEETKKAGGTTEDSSEESADKLTGGVTEVSDDIAGTNTLLISIEEILQSIDDKTPSLEDQREAGRDKGKKAGGKVVKKKKDDEGFSLMGLLGTLAGALAGAIAGLGAGIVLGVMNFYKDIFKWLKKGITKIFPNVTKMLSDVFGKGGKISKFFTSIKAFFTESKAFKVMSDLIEKGKAAINKVMKPIKAVFTTMKTGFLSFIAKIKGWIGMISGPIDTVKGLLGGGKAKGATTALKGFGGAFKTFFGIFKGFFAKLFYPLTPIIALIEGFFEAKDAVGKSEGFLASFFNSIVGFVGGIIDSIVFQMADMIKSAISWIAGFLGFGDVEKSLDSFSFSEIFNEFLDDIYKWFNLLFSDPVAALTNLVSSIFGGILSINDFIVDVLKKPLVWIMGLFGWDDAAAATDAFSLSVFVMEKWNAVVGWVKGLFAWGKKAGADGEGGWSLMTFVNSVWGKVVGWVKGLFAWGKKAGATKDGGWSLMTFIYGKDGVVNTVIQWFKDLFSFGKEGEKTNIVGTIVDSLKDLPGKLLILFTDLIDKIIGIIPGMGPDSAGEKSEKTLKELGLFVENYTEKDQVDLKGMQKGLETGAITKEDIANMLADQGNGDFEEAKGQFTPAQFNAMVALAGKDVVQQSFARINSGNARGGVVVNRPTYLPSTGTVVGEHGTFGGKGAAGGGIPMDGGPEAIIPLTGNRAQGFIEPIAASIAGAVMNQLAMSRVGMSSSGGGGAQNLTDASSTNNVITNNTIISSPEPTGQMLPGAGRDHATSHFRHAA